MNPRIDLNKINDNIVLMKKAAEELDRMGKDLKGFPLSGQKYGSYTGKLENARNKCIRHYGVIAVVINMFRLPDLLTGENIVCN
jgi:hypothetical protein